MNNQYFTKQQLIEYATLSKEDVQKIFELRTSHNSLGYAYQLAFVRLKNRLPTQRPFEILDELLEFISTQVGIDAADIHKYTSRQPTVSEHQAEIRNYLKLREFIEVDIEMVRQFVFDQSFRLERTEILFSLVEQYLKERSILKPADSTLHRLIGEQKRFARQHIYGKITDSLSDEVRQELDKLLEVKEKTFSIIQQLKSVPYKPSPNGLNQLIDKLEQVQSTNVLQIDLTWLNNNYQRTLANYVQKCSADRLRELSASHRYAAIVCFLQQTYGDTIDQIVDMYDKLINKVYNWAQEYVDESLRLQRQSIQRSLSMFTIVGELMLNATVSDDHIRETFFSRVSQESLAAQVEQSKEWISSKKNHVFQGFIEYFSYLRQFSKSFLEHLEFELSQKESPQIRLNVLLDAISILREMNQSGKRRLPPESPVAFVPRKFKSFVESKGEIDKQAWECALLTVLRDEIKSGNLFVTHSKRFGNFDDFFIPMTQWRKGKESFYSDSRLPNNPHDARIYLTERLNHAYDSFIESQPLNTYAKVAENKWQLSSDPTEKLTSQEEDKLKQLKSWLEKKMRSIKLPELLIEVDNELHYTQHFMPIISKEIRSVSDVCAILTTIMAHGCNVGPYTMSRMVQGVSYRQIQRITDWQMTEDNQRSALASLVNAIADLDTSQTWGQGKTSASDGQRFSFHRQVLQQTFSTRFSDFALEFYSFVADNYAPFYSMPIECTDRDAAFVLDGLLYNESDLELEEHYTDTHGYTENNFAAFAMLGRRFCPRIRSMQNQRIYRIDIAKDYGILEPLVHRRDRIIKMDWIVDQWDRMGQFYATIKSGHTTANVAIGRLNAMSPKNEFYRANRELGRIFKTEFILQYMSQPLLRRRVRRGLLKVDQLHSLARDIVYGKRGRMTEQDFHEMIKTCSCLTLIIACIVYWQSKEIERAISECNPEIEGIDVSLLEHVSPIEWDNVLLYGEYVLDPGLIK